MSVRVSSSSLYLSVDVFVCEGMCVHLRPSVGLLLFVYGKRKHNAYGNGETGKLIYFGVFAHVG